MDIQWISTADRLPPEDTECWIVVVFKDGGRGTDIALYSRCGWENNHDDFPRESVSHWALYVAPELPPIA